MFCVLVARTGRTAGRLLQICREVAWRYFLLHCLARMRLARQVEEMSWGNQRTKWWMPLAMFDYQEGSKQIMPTSFTDLMIVRANVYNCHQMP